MAALNKMIKRPLTDHLKAPTQLVNIEYKSRILKELKEDAVKSISDCDLLLIKILEQDLADGGVRFEDLYIASNSFYGS